MNFWTEPIRIGTLSVPRFIGGPLDGITDSPFRRLVREFSKDELLYTEMRHVAHVANDKQGKSLAFEQLERPLNYQVAANKLDFIEPALEKILACGVDSVDLNVGCPSKQVTGSGSGSALMADPERLELLVKRLRTVTSVPLTVKIRAGYKECNAVEIAKMLEQCGVDALAIHPRLQSQRFEGRPDYELVAKVKRSVSIPTIVSGGVVNFKTAKLVHEQTGADGFLIGRGIWARPWKLLELKEHAAERLFSMKVCDALVVAVQHLNAMIVHYGDYGVFLFRKHVPFYLRGIPQASKMRAEIMKLSAAEQVVQCLKQAAQAVDQDAIVRI